MRFFLASSLSEAHSLTGDQHLDTERLVVVRALFRADQVAGVSPSFPLRVFQKDALEVEKAAIGDNSLDVTQEVALNEGVRGLEASVEIDGAQNCLEGISDDRRPVSSSRQVLFSAEQEMVTESDSAAPLRENDFADEYGFDLGEIAFTFVLKLPIEVFRDQQVQYGVAEKLEPFVRSDAPFVNGVDVRAVFDRLDQKIGIRKTIAEFFLEAFRGVRYPVAPEPACNRMSDFDKSDELYPAGIIGRRNRAWRVPRCARRIRRSCSWPRGPAFPVPCWVRSPGRTPDRDVRN